MLQGSCSLNLGQPRDAIVHFEAAAAAAGLGAADAYREDEFPRGAAIYLAREAEARIALDDLDGAIDTADTAVPLLAFGAKGLSLPALAASSRQARVATRMSASTLVR